jgi:hypothetical protein
VAKRQGFTSRDQLALLAGVTVPTLDRNLRAGAPRPPSDPDGAQQWLKDYHNWREQNRRKPGPKAAEGAEAAKHELEKAKLALLRARREALQLEIDERKGRLIRRSDVVDYASAAVLQVSQRLDGLVARMAARLGPVCQGGEAQVEEMIRLEVEEIRSDFAAGMGKAHG